MAEMDKVWVGADPGGKGSFGLAFVHVSGQLCCYTVSSVEEAVKRIVRVGMPLGIGIDAPMWWSAGPGAGRCADARLRERYGLSGGTVQSGNSLRGAALIGGALLASRVREKFPSVRITESHPKALLGAFEWDGPSFAKKFGMPMAWSNEHERDAAIAAVCAREGFEAAVCARQGFEGRWCADLAKKRYACEQNPQAYWLAPMHYFWPEEV